MLTVKTVHPFCASLLESDLCLSCGPYTVIQLTTVNGPFLVVKFHQNSANVTAPLYRKYVHTVPKGKQHRKMSNGLSLSSLVSHYFGATNK